MTVSGPSSATYEGGGGGEKGKGKAGTLRTMYKDFLKRMEVLEEKEKVSITSTTTYRWSIVVSHDRPSCLLMVWHDDRPGQMRRKKCRGDCLVPSIGCWITLGLPTLLFPSPLLLLLPPWTLIVHHHHPPITSLAPAAAVKAAAVVRKQPHRPSIHPPTEAHVI